MVVFERTILVVEDDFIQRRQLVSALGEVGYRLFQASGGLQAICLLGSQKIHLVLTDIRMPGLDGISLLKYVKTFFPHIPVIIATAYPGEMEGLKPDALLCKPFGPEELISWVRRLIQ
jgi:CheY-like chemotaxis protein